MTDRFYIRVIISYYFLKQIVRPVIAADDHVVDVFLFENERVLHKCVIGECEVDYLAVKIPAFKAITVGVEINADNVIKFLRHKRVHRDVVDYGSVIVPGFVDLDRSVIYGHAHACFKIGADLFRVFFSEILINKLHMSIVEQRYIEISVKMAVRIIDFFNVLLYDAAP